MDDMPTVAEARERGAGLAAPADIVLLYQEAFDRFGPRALWSYRRDIRHPTVRQALMIASALKSEGDLQARVLAIQIEQACRAAV